MRGPRSSAWRPNAMSAPAAALAAALRADRPAMLVAVGGPAASQAASDGVLELADGIVSAVDAVRRALDATG